MKHSHLHNVAHNFADSLASGVSLIIGRYDLDVFGVAASSTQGSVVVDFLNGSVVNEVDDEELEEAILLFREAFPDFCERNGAISTDFERFFAKYTTSEFGNSYVVTIEDRNGRVSSREYYGVPGRRAETTDHLGRRRPKPHPPLSE